MFGSVRTTTPSPCGVVVTLRTGTSIPRTLAVPRALSIIASTLWK